MIFENPFACFESVIPSRICDLIIADAELQNPEVALTGDYGSVDLQNQKDVSTLYKTRNSSIVWMDDSWIYREVIPFVQEANRVCGWNFDLTKPESCQFTKYSESQHYTWHQDSWKTPYHKPGEPDHGLIRKISVTVSLADGEDYDGGDLEFDLRNNKDGLANIVKSDLARKKGSITVFPSYIWHRVTPVSRGTRYSLVVWNLGNPFR
jgi:PKHD-type hydroxylase